MAEMSERETVEVAEAKAKASPTSEVPPSTCNLFQIFVSQLNRINASL
jgi:hypothetical protein